MNLTEKLIFVRRLVAVCVPKSFRGRVPKKTSKHLYFYGWISAFNNEKHLKSNLIDSLTGSPHRNILVFKTEYRKQVESIVHELAKSY